MDWGLQVPPDFDPRSARWCSSTVWSQGPTSCGSSRKPSAPKAFKRSFFEYPNDGPIASFWRATGQGSEATRCKTSGVSLCHRGAQHGGAGGSVLPGRFPAIIRVVSASWVTLGTPHHGTPKRHFSPFWKWRANFYPGLGSVGGTWSAMARAKARWNSFRRRSGLPELACNGPRESAQQRLTIMWASEPADCLTQTSKNAKARIWSKTTGIAESGNRRSERPAMA